MTSDLTQNNMIQINTGIISRRFVLGLFFPKDDTDDVSFDKPFFKSLTQNSVLQNHFEPHVFNTLDEALSLFRPDPYGVLMIADTLLLDESIGSTLKKINDWMPQVKIVSFEAHSNQTAVNSQRVIDLINQNMLFWHLQLAEDSPSEAVISQDSLGIVLNEAYQQIVDHQAKAVSHNVVAWQAPTPAVQKQLVDLVEASSNEGEKSWVLAQLMKRWACRIGGDALECSQAFWAGAFLQMDLSRFWVRPVHLDMDALGWLVWVFYPSRAGAWQELFHHDSKLDNPLHLPVPMGSPNVLRDEEMAQVLGWFSHWIRASEFEKKNMLESGETWFTPTHWGFLQKNNLLNGDIEKMMIDGHKLAEQELEFVFELESLNRQAG